MQVTEQEDEKEEESRQAQDSNQSSLSPERGSGCFDDKAVYFHRLSVPDLPLVPQSHGLDLGKHCVDVCMCVSKCACLHLFAPIIFKLMVRSHSW